jgi:hypothetical protein
MPPKRSSKAAAGRKRPSLAVDAPAARRQKTAAPADEETTTVEVYGFDKEWLGPLAEMYAERELTDVVLTVGDHSVAAHRVVLATISPHFKALFSGGDVGEPVAGDRA